MSDAYDWDKADKDIRWKMFLEDVKSFINKTMEEAIDGDIDYIVSLYHNGISEEMVAKKIVLEIVDNLMFGGKK